MIFDIKLRTIRKMEFEEKWKWWDEGI